MNQITLNETDIQQRAYQIWEAEGRPHGRDQEHWYRAMSEMATVKPKRASRKRSPAPPSAPKTTSTRKRAKTTTKKG